MVWRRNALSIKQIDIETCFCILQNL